MNKIFIACCLLLISVQANASIITYTDRTTFQSNAGSLFSFEGFNNSFDTPIIVNPAGSYQSFWSTKPTEGTHSLGLIERSGVTFTFSTSVYAFGFDVTELNELGLDYSDSAGHFLSGAIPINGSDQFFGVVSDTLISSFTLGSGNDSSGSVYFIDALETRGAGSPVPEPATMLLFGIGLLGLTGVNRNKN